MNSSAKAYPIFRHAALAFAIAGLVACAGGPASRPAVETQTISVAPALERAQSRLAERQTQLALAELAGIKNPAMLSASEQARYHDLRAQALDLAGDWQASVAERVALADALAGNPEAAADNQDRLWRTLRRQRAEVLKQAQDRAESPVLAGWLELAGLAATFAIDPLRLAREIENWRQQHPEHPAARRLPPELNQGAGEAIAAFTPRHIALLLPMTGPLANSATLIRDGVIAAYYRHNEAAMPELKVYDTGAVDAMAQYQKAVAEGADFIIGPLEKEAVQRLASAPSLPVATLSLNRAEKPGPAKNNFFQLGLIPDDEAMRLAERASEDGRQRAIALLPRSPLGQRLATLLPGQFQAAGGQVLTTVYFDNGPLMDGAIREALGLNLSEARFRAVQSIVGGKLGFEPRRRGDADSLFLSADPDEARQLKPLLDYYNAQDLPVYASNRVYSGDATADRDLEGVGFPDQPWIIGHSPELDALRSQMKRLFPASTDKRIGRLFALGFDAYLVIPQLHQLHNTPGYRLAGLTGELTLTGNGWLVQHQPWARISDGLAQPWPVRH